MRVRILSVVIIVGVLALCLPGATSSAGEIHKQAGTSSFSFLKINVGARAVAMGGAFTGLADDESALYYNPAGIARFEGTRFVAGYHNYFVDLQSGFLGYIRKHGEAISLGWYASYLDYGEFVRTDEAGNRLGEFGGGDLLLAMTVAARKGYDLSFGVTAKFIYETVEEFTATGVAADVGMRYSYLRDRVSVGLAIKNIGVQLSSLGEEKDRLPLSVRGGAAIRPRGLPITLAGDVIIPVDNDPVVAVGGEYWEFRPFYARVGWNSFGANYRTADSDDSWAGFALGVGFDIKQLQISYAFAPGAELGESHRITLTGGM